MSTDFRTFWRFSLWASDFTRSLYVDVVWCSHLLGSSFRGTWETCTGSLRSVEWPQGSLRFATTSRASPFFYTFSYSMITGIPFVGESSKLVKGRVLLSMQIRNMTIQFCRIHDTMRIPNWGILSYKRFGKILKFRRIITIFVKLCNNFDSGIVRYQAVSC